MEIKHPEWLRIEADNRTMFGYSQEWYRTSFQRTRGCGPTAAAMLLLYLNKREAEPLPYKNHSISAITQVLENVWDFVTPNWLLGLNSTNKFCQGVTKLVEHYGLGWKYRRLSIPVFNFRRPTLSQVVSFLEAGVDSDCPIAFLNLHKGKVTTMETWHWTVLVALTYDAGDNRYLATAYDGGRSITFDLGLWLESSKIGGGFVYIITN
ncbi:hypothetical protein SPFL3102_03150 [Sporomusaceae bacterium FL31]|nr:hypothetical protein SPFL3101_00894 [Sporomusaceae bacterium FL31]GCE35314.1 hypothetical protein SPFL3102_03150 [Sporomusaceae bacterium]